MVLPLSDSVVKPENLTDIISDRRLPTGVHLSTTAEVPGLVQLQRPLDTRVCFRGVCDQLVGASQTKPPVHSDNDIHT